MSPAAGSSASRPAMKVVTMPACKSQNTASHSETSGTTVIAISKTARLLSGRRYGANRADHGFDALVNGGIFPKVNAGIGLVIRQLIY